MSDSTQGTLSNISGSIYLDGAKHESKQIKQRHIKNKEAKNKKSPTCRIRTSDLRIPCLNNYSPPLCQLS